MIAGLIALVVVALSAAGLFALVGASNDAVVAAWSPSDAVAYVEVRGDLPGDQRQNLGAFLAHFPGFADQSTLQTKLDETLDKLISKASDGKQDWSKDIKPWFGGQVAMSFSSFPTMTMTDPRRGHGRLPLPPRRDPEGPGRRDGLGEVAVRLRDDRGDIQGRDPDDLLEQRDEGRRRRDRRGPAGRRRGLGQGRDRSQRQGRPGQHEVVQLGDVVDQGRPGHPDVHRPQGLLRRADLDDRHDGRLGRPPAIDARPAPGVGRHRRANRQRRPGRHVRRPDPLGDADRRRSRECDRQARCRRTRSRCSTLTTTGTLLKGQLDQLRNDPTLGAALKQADQAAADARRHRPPHRLDR